MVQKHNYNRLVKHSGQVFTPDFLVEDILNYSGYVSGNILQKHVIENSCGDGAFLCEIVARYCDDFLTSHGHNEGLKEELEHFIHGIELDKTAFENCLYNLNLLVANYSLSNVNWDILNADALSVTKYDGMMDFVIGNPPYVRVHHLEEDYNEVKSFKFAQDGMTDLYLVFYELGFRMLNAKGKLCYITPSSWLSSLAATNMRNYILEKRNLVGLIDLGHFQAFEKAITYTMIVLFDFSKKTHRIDYYRFTEEKKDKTFVDSFSYAEMSIGNKFYVGARNDLAWLRSVKSTLDHPYAQVKNGFATLADRVFINDVPFTSLTIPILKASTGKWKRGFYPYDKQGKPLDKEFIFSHPDISDYLHKNISLLLKNKTIEEKPDWYLYGRTQALKDVYSTKYAINTIIKEIKSIKLTEVPIGAGIYSGLYILTSVSLDVVEKIVKSDDFLKYLSILKNYKSGGYYTFNSKDLEQYLNYKLNQYERKNNIISSH